MIQKYMITTTYWGEQWAYSPNLLYLQSICSSWISLYIFMPISVYTILKFVFNSNAQPFVCQNCFKAECHLLYNSLHFEQCSNFFLKMPTVELESPSISDPFFMIGLECLVSYLDSHYC